MGYKVLGYLVWNVGKLVVRRKVRGAATTRNLAIAGVLGVAIAGAVVAGSRSSD
jgi:hypothetical protein